MTQHRLFLILALAILALVPRAAIPAGWMPAAHGGGLILCHGTAAASDHDGHQGSKQQRAASDHSCAFSALGQGLDQATTIALSSPPAQHGIAAVWIPHVAARQGLPAPPPPAIGPPLLA